MGTASYEDAQKGKEKLKALLGDRKELSGIGICPLEEGGYGVKVNLTEPLHDETDIQSLIPGIEVFVKVVGPITFLHF